ncbi:MAG: hypothetical protein AOA65_1531 [Candidatus Bathyarchaeota archaeon BA1]|nr:MAG: hypothetical protein AOA65_1531 [Candidatus Bathyarchaeota archaeon BA1]
MEAKQHTLDHLKIVPKHCYVVKADNNGIIGVMVLHLQEKIFEIEDFRVKRIEQTSRLYYYSKLSYLNI